MSKKWTGACFALLLGLLGLVLGCLMIKDEEEKNEFCFGWGICFVIKFLIEILIFYFVIIKIKNM